MKAKHALSVLAVLLLAIACRRDDDDADTPSTPVDGRDLFAGHYNVYDLQGHLLYQMNITKLSDAGHDSLYVDNWGNAFGFAVRHEDGDHSNGFGIIPPFPTYDHDGHRWALGPYSDIPFRSNKLISDTLRMAYEKDNIAFYSQDGVPYQSIVVHEYAVKQ